MRAFSNIAADFPSQVTFACLAQRLTWLLILLCALSHSAEAQIELERLFPPVVAAGRETTVTAEGKFPQWPPSVACDSENVAIAMGEESGSLIVTVADNVSPGVVWLRFFDDQSATSLVPLVVSAVEVFSETEPNDKRSQANQLSMPTVVAGRLAKNGDSDAYRLSIQAGQTLVVSATASQVLKSPMDAVLQLTDLRGHVLDQSDDVRGLDPQIVFTSNVDQDLLIRIFAFPETPTGTVDFAGSAAFVYSLDVTTGPFLDHAASDGHKIVPFGYNLDDPAAVVLAPELSPIDSGKPNTISPPAATVRGGLGWSWLPPVAERVHQLLPGEPFDGALPALLMGHFTKADETHHYAFTASQGAKYRAEVRSKSAGFLVDSKLTITDQKSGKTLASNDDISNGGYDAGIDFTAPEDGIVDVAISEILGGFGPRHFYHLSIHRSEPQCSLSVAKEHFVATLEQPLEITISVTRTSGFNPKVRIEATNLPEGITSQSVISDPADDTAKSVKLTLFATENAVGHGSFQITGTVVDAADKPASDAASEAKTSEAKTSDDLLEAVFNLRPSVSVKEFWLTVPPASNEKAQP